MNPLRIACCGGWQAHAKDFPMNRAVTHCSDLPHSFPVVWDDNVERGKAWAEEMGARFEEDYDKVLQDPSIDGVIITAATMKHFDMASKAVLAGKHVYLEKPMTIDLVEAYRLQKLVKGSKIHFTISDPPARSPWILYATSLIRSGALGEVTSVRIHMGHGEGLHGWSDDYYDTAQSGGGAMSDMGYHCLHATNLLLGEPVQVTGIILPVTDRGIRWNADENSAAIVEYENKTLGIVETGWLTDLYQYGLQVYGTEGFLSVANNMVSVKLGREGTVTTLSIDQLPKEDYPLRYFMRSILEDFPNEIYDIDDAVKVVEVEAALKRAIETKQTVDVRRVIEEAKIQASSFN